VGSDVRDQPGCKTVVRNLIPNNAFTLLPLDGITVSQYYNNVIKSFKSSETERVFRRRFSRKLPQTIQPIAYRKLAFIHSARVIQDLKLPPANYLEKLHGDREGQYSIRINDQWRICFQWRDGDAYEVEIVDYH
jgi:toxin HigB-1